MIRDGLKIIELKVKDVITWIVMFWSEYKIVSHKLKTILYFLRDIFQR
jgi:hypothetical protein